MGERDREEEGEREAVRVSVCIEDEWFLSKYTLLLAQTHIFCSISTLCINSKLLPQLLNLLLNTLCYCKHQKPIYKKYCWVFSVHLFSLKMFPPISWLRSTLQGPGSLWTCWTRYNRSCRPIKQNLSFNGSVSRLCFTYNDVFERSGVVCLKTV